jgi:hypothetical protein
MKKYLSLASCLLFVACATQAGAPTTTAIDEQSLTAPAPGAGEEGAPALTGPSPVGPISAEAAGSYPISLRLNNAGDTPLAMTHLAVAVQVMRDDEVVEGCAENNSLQPSEGPETLPAGESHVYTVGLPCALTEPGEYQVRAYMSLDERESGEELTISEETLHGAFYLKVREEMEPFQVPAQPAAPATAAVAPEAAQQ